MRMFTEHLVPGDIRNKSMSVANAAEQQKVTAISSVLMQLTPNMVSFIAFSLLAWGNAVDSAGAYQKGCQQELEEPQWPSA